MKLVGFATRSLTLDSDKSRGRATSDGIEAALIVLHRRETNRSPTANFDRIIEGTFGPPTSSTTLVQDRVFLLGSCSEVGRFHALTQR